MADLLSDTNTSLDVHVNLLLPPAIIIMEMNTEFGQNTLIITL